MGWTSLRITPGFLRNATRYAASGTWFDGSLVRFRDGFPEKWGGWTERYVGFTFTGVCRSLYSHGTLDGTRWVSAGTSERFYMLSDGAIYDVSPIIDSGTLTNPFAITNGSDIVTVTDTSHNRTPGESVIFSGAVDVGNITAAMLNGEHTVLYLVDANKYTFRATATATSTVASGGGTVTFTYPFRAGAADAISGGGWGALAWSDEEWGGDYDQPVVSGGVALFGVFDQMGIWSQDNWGEDLVACAQGGPIFYWDATTPSATMVNIRNLPALPGPIVPDGHAPKEAQFIIVSHRDRHLLAFGGTMLNALDPNETRVEPMTVRWCDQENIYVWLPSDINSAGDLPLSNGSKFISGIATSREILAWTDKAMYSIQYVGGTYVYTAELIERWSDICGLKAVTSFNGVVYWMGKGGFYAYSGRTEKIPCPIWDYISVRLNREQAQKVYASSNQLHDEVLFFYPSTDLGNLENDSYACFDVVQNLWTFGALDRTAWMDGNSLDQPLAASPRTKKLFEHDKGSDDGSTSPPLPIPAFIESGPIELSSEGSYDKGDKFMFVRKILPDVTFRDLTSSSDIPRVSITLKMMDKPGGGFIENEATGSPVSRSVTIPVEQFTDEAHVRLRGRALTVRVESNSLGTNWRLGVPRIDARTDGQR